MSIEQFQILKESLTFLLNYEFSWIKMAKDNWYSSHQEFRKKLEEYWISSQSKTFEGLIDYWCDLLLS